MPPTSSAARRQNGQAGFALAEVVLALAILALVVGVALPDSARAPGPAAVRAAALDIASLLKSDRNAAIRLGENVVTHVDVIADAVRSGALGGDLRLQRGLDLTALSGSAAGRNDISFRPSGSSPGGAILLAGRSATYRIDVAAVTGHVSVSNATSLP